MSHADELIVDLEDEHLDPMYLIFIVKAETYGIPIACITKIVGLQKIATVPDAPTFIKGVINLLGQVSPVMDIRTRFNIPE